MSQVERCANCPYTAKDRKMCYNIELVSPFKSRKSKIVSVKSALDTIFKFNQITLETNSDEQIGLCENCSELLTELLTCHEAFNSPRSYDSYVASNLRKIDSTLISEGPQNPRKIDSTLMSEGPQNPPPLSVEPFTNQISSDWNDGASTTSSSTQNQMLSIEPPPDPPLNCKSEDDPATTLTEIIPVEVSFSPTFQVKEILNLSEVKGSVNVNEFREDPFMTVQLVRLNSSQIEAATERSQIVSKVSDAHSKVETLLLENPIGTSNLVKQEFMDDFFPASAYLEEDYMNDDDPLDTSNFTNEMVDRKPYVSGNPSISPNSVENELSSKTINSADKEEWVKQILSSKKKTGPTPGVQRNATVSRLITLTCPVCVNQSKIYNSPKDFYLHLCTHISKSGKKGKRRFTDNGFIKCPVCTSSLAKYSIYSHLMIHANYLPFVCTISNCGKGFTSACALKIHTNVHLTTSSVASPSFKLKSGLDGKLKTKQLNFRRVGRPKGVPKPKMIFKCELCDRECQSKAAVESHIRRKHTNDRPFPCDLCNRSFVHKSDLENHEKTLLHQRLQRYKDGGGSLEVKPQQEESMNDLMMENEMTAAAEIKEGEIISPDSEWAVSHGNVMKISKSLFANPPTKSKFKSSSAKNLGRRKKEVCPLCKKQMVNLNLHMILKHKMPSKKNTLEKQEKQKFQCRTCQKFYSSALGLKSHQEMVHGDENVQCQLCDKNFSCLARLRQHVKRIHIQLTEDRGD